MTAWTKQAGWNRETGGGQHFLFSAEVNCVPRPVLCRSAAAPVLLWHWSGPHTVDAPPLPLGCGEQKETCGNRDLLLPLWTSSWRGPFKSTSARQPTSVRRERAPRKSRLVRSDVFLAFSKVPTTSSISSSSRLWNMALCFDDDCRGLGFVAKYVTTGPLTEGTSRRDRDNDINPTVDSSVGVCRPGLPVLLSVFLSGSLGVVEKCALDEPPPLNERMRRHTDQSLGLVVGYRAPSPGTCRVVIRRYLGRWNPCGRAPS